MSDPDIDPLSEAEVPGSPMGPGHRLRLARERKGLDLQTVAEGLHLPAPRVAALENDDYSSVASAVFAQGYLRNYARLVDEPVEEIVNAFNALKPLDEYRPVLQQFQPRVKGKQVTSSHGLVRAVTWLVVVGLIVLLVIWWRGDLALQVPQIGESVPDINPLEDGWQESPITLDLDAADTPRHEPAPPVEERKGVLEPATVLTVEAPAEQPGEAVPGTVSESGLPGLPDEAGVGTGVNDQIRSTVDAASTPPGEAVDAADGAEDLPDSASDGVVMRFGAPCWVDIRDSSGEKVLFGGIDTGETHTLGGTPPYHAVIGNSSAVTITVGGRPFDTAPHARGEVARFTLDPAAFLGTAGGEDR